MTIAAPTPWTVRAAISAPAEPVADGGRGHQQHREGQGVGVDGPFELPDRGAQVVADGAQRGRDDQQVQHDHERRHRRQRQGPALGAGHGLLRARGVHVPSSFALWCLSLMQTPRAAANWPVSFRAGWCRYVKDLAQSQAI